MPTAYPTGVPTGVPTGMSTGVHTGHSGHPEHSDRSNQSVWTDQSGRSDWPECGIMDLGTCSRVEHSCLFPIVMLALQSGPATKSR